MVDVSSIVVAILSLVGTLLIGIAGILYTWNTDDRKRRSEAQNLVAKYRDPLMIAAHDLRSRLYGLSDLGLAEFHRGDTDQKDNLRMYTAFVVGQYLSWSYILRRQAQFLKFSTNKKNNDLTRVLAQITDCFASGSLKTDLDDAPFQLWRAQQIAIGELMTVHDGSELYCMGYAAFRKAYHASMVPEGKAADNSISTAPAAAVSAVMPPAPAQSNDPAAPPAAADPAKQAAATQSPGGVQVTVTETFQDMFDPNPDFKSWFRPIIQGAETIAQARCAVLDITARNPHSEPLPVVPDQKIRKLQHLLFDLAQTLDPAFAAGDVHFQSGNTANDRCHRADKCKCAMCSEREECPSVDNKRVKCKYPHGGDAQDTTAGRTSGRAKAAGSKV